MASENKAHLWKVLYCNIKTIRMKFNSYGFYFSTLLTRRMFVDQPPPQFQLIQMLDISVSVGKHVT